jgi:flavin-dependent dehydrogenase
MPQGYAWIFPMSNSRLKIGVIRYFQNKNYVPYNPSYHYYINQLLALCEPCNILDKHGKTVYYTKGQKDVRFSGPVIAIGDAVSSVNTLGWEGIRHALYSGRFAAQAILAYLKNPIKGFNSYERALNHYFGYKWLFSEMYMNYLFKTKSDHLIDQTVRAFGNMNNDEIMQVLFEYKFRYALKSYLKEWLKL